ncbi:MAG: SMP-30/gluconolactonase/LRE family protein [Planctomycetes bacterium]|nr:SMP-30/gluconolactonase/LRE family protein [Planctomycetota bacterium]
MKLSPLPALASLPARLACALLGCTALASAQESAAPAAASLAADAQLAQVATGFQFTEGPAWCAQGYLLFSDVHASRIVRWDEKEGVATFLQPSSKANGLMFDAQGRLVACESESRRLVRIDPATKEVTVLAESFGGKKLNSPNDLTIDAEGGVYFTDPRYGNGEPLEQDAMAVYYVAADGKLARVIGDLPRPNGIHLSPDGAFLYVANPNLRQIVRYPVEAPGKLGAGVAWFTGDEKLDGTGPDGMTIDERGNVYATYAGLVVIAPSGAVLTRLAVPERPTNCAFGGADFQTLFVTARTSLYSVRAQVRGMGLPKSASSEATQTVVTGELSLAVPASWKFSEPTSNMRLGQFAVPGPGGEAELVVFYFGAGGAGGVRANIERWIGQFAAEGRTTQIAKGACASGDYAVVTCHGTYNQPVGPPIRRESKAMPGSAMIALIVPTAKGDHFLKLAGPQKTVEAAASALRRAIGVKGAERAVTLEELGG